MLSGIVVYICKNRTSSITKIYTKIVYQMSVHYLFYSVNNSLVLKLIFLILGVADSSFVYNVTNTSISILSLFPINNLKLSFVKFSNSCGVIPSPFLTIFLSVIVAHEPFLKYLYVTLLSIDNAILISVPGSVSQSIFVDN